MQNREDKNSFRSFLFKKQYENVKNGNKKGFRIYIRK
jgi:hypothetical protein